MNQNGFAELLRKRVKELKIMAKDRSIKGYYRLKKGELVKKILQLNPEPRGPSTPSHSPETEPKSKNC